MMDKITPALMIAVCDLSVDEPNGAFSLGSCVVWTSALSPRSGKWGFVAPTDSGQAADDLADVFESMGSDTIETMVNQLRRLKLVRVEYYIEPEDDGYSGTVYTDLRPTEKGRQLVRKLGVDVELALLITGDEE